MSHWKKQLGCLFGLYLMLVGFTHASQPSPFVVYDDELKNGWVNWSWADVILQAPIGGAKPIKVSGGAWSALALHHDAFSIDQFSVLRFVINGGSKGEQTLAVKLISDGKPIESNYIIKPKTREWQLAEIPLEQLGAAGQQIDGIWIQAQDKGIAPFYVTRIEFR